MAMRYPEQDDIEEDPVEEVEEDDEEVKAKRRGGRVYDMPCVAFRSVETAERLFKYQFMGAYWRRVGTRGDVGWYACKCCGKRMKLQLINVDGRCQASFEIDFFDETHDYSNKENNRVGLPQEVKDKVLTYDKLGGKPVAILEQLRKEGNLGI